MLLRGLYSKYGKTSIVVESRRQNFSAVSNQAATNLQDVLTASVTGSSRSLIPKTSCSHLWWGCPGYTSFFLAVFPGILPFFFPSRVRAGKKRSNGWRTDLTFPMLQRLPPSRSRGMCTVAQTCRGTNTTFSISLNMWKKANHLQKHLIGFIGQAVEIASC